MRIQRLYIGDFGIFRNQTLDKLSPGFIVIGGLNRAGKTTFLQMLRYLGYGLPRVESLPSAASRYEIESDVILDSGDRFCIRLLGHGEPQVSCLTGGRQIDSSRELYNDLDPFTYWQLFTISLDELQRSQKGRDNQELEKLHSIMLGAGLADIVGIPQVVDEFRKSSKDLGGTYGRVNVARFKEFYNEIMEGLALRNEAAQQIDFYQDTNERLEQITNEICEVETRLIQLENESTRLDVLKNNFQNYSQLQNLRSNVDVPGVEELISEFKEVRIETVVELRNQYEGILKEYENRVLMFGKNIADGDVQGSVNRLMQHFSDLEGFKFRLSGLRERADNYVEQCSDHSNDEHDIAAELTRIDKSWNGEFERVLELKCDKLQLDEVAQDVSAYQQLESSLYQYERDLAKLNSVREHIEIELSEITVSDESAVLKRYFYLAVLFALGGMVLSAGSLWFGIVVAGTGIIGSAVYIFVKFSMSNVLRERKFDLEFQLKGIASQIGNVVNEITSLQDAALELAGKLQHYRNLLRLESDVSPDMIKEYFRDVQGLKKRILRWMAFGNGLEETRLSVEKELRQLAGLLGQLQGAISVDIYGDRLLEHREHLFGLLEESMRLLDLAKTLKSVENRKKDIEQQIREIVQCEGDEALVVLLDEFIRRGQTAARLSDMRDECERLRKQITQSLNMDAIRKALLDFADGFNLTDDAALLDVFSTLYQQFSSVDGVRKAYGDCNANLSSLQKRLEELKDERRFLLTERERLATTERLEQAQRKIDKARAGLRPLAEKYAVYNAASFILGKVQERFMENTKDTLLRDASYALSRITRGEYIQILPSDNFSEVDFRTVLTDGTKQDTVDILSRATREQLFLSIRLSRIREVQPPLPVIMDDSFVNFDRHHLEQAIEILGELSETHQIFLLTCHPHLVDQICKYEHDAQFWRLDQGKFNRSSGQELVRYLEADGRKKVNI